MRRADRGAARAFFGRVHKLVISAPTAADERIRRIARTRAGRAAGKALAPLFPLGLPGGYLLIAYAMAQWLRRHGHDGGREIVRSAWLGWIVHRAVKVGLERRRPPKPGTRVRYDSFPSGHTTGATSLAVATAIVLRRERLVSPSRATAIAVAPSVIMGVYRVLADDHWATDVVGGWILGAAIGVASATREAKPRRVRRRGRPVRPTSEATRGRADSPDARAHTARPSVR